MFSVVGLTLDEVSSGSLPHLQLAKTLDTRMTKSNFRYAERILVYTTIETDTHGSTALIWLPCQSSCSRLCWNPRSLELSGFREVEIADLHRRYHHLERLFPGGPHRRSHHLHLPQHLQN